MTTEAADRFLIDALMNRTRPLAPGVGFPD